MPPEKFAELRVKHLEMVQALVTRMAGYGVSFKTYCITVVTAVLGFAFSLKVPNVALLALLPLLTFAAIDAQYLRLERRFRGLFNAVRTQDWATPPSFEINLSSAPPSSYWSALSSWSIVCFYGLLTIGIVIAVIGARYAYG
ncbi:hypothetical protein [Tardiphaga sp. 839_C3_N1_4]|uniref:hypothetical protein n=1 Tax=Tardiphaga sp. 839_C3_N1_4 TaxID=3240761 RepID=UPI003F1E85BC